MAEKDNTLDLSDAEAFLSDEELIAFFAKQRGLSLEEARARLKEILESVSEAKT